MLLASCDTILQYLMISGQTYQIYSKIVFIELSTAKLTAFGQTPTNCGEWNETVTLLTQHITFRSLQSAHVPTVACDLIPLPLLMLRSETHISQFNLLNLLTGHMWAHLYVFFFPPLTKEGGEAEDIWYVVFRFVDDVWISTEATSSSSNPIGSERERPHGAEKKVKHQNLLVTNYQTNWIRITQQKRAWS